MLVQVRESGSAKIVAGVFEKMILAMKAFGAGVFDTQKSGLASVRVTAVSLAAEKNLV